MIVLDIISAVPRCKRYYLWLCCGSDGCQRQILHVKSDALPVGDGPVADKWTRSAFNKCSSHSLLWTQPYCVGCGEWTACHSNSSENSVSECEYEFPWSRFHSRNLYYVIKFQCQTFLLQYRNTLFVCLCFWLARPRSALFTIFRRRLCRLTTYRNDRVCVRVYVYMTARRGVLFYPRFGLHFIGFYWCGYFAIRPVIVSHQNEYRTNTLCYTTFAGKECRKRTHHFVHLFLVRWHFTIHCGVWCGIE